MGPKIQCRICKDIIQSTSVHEYVKCSCEMIAIDGGDEYTRVICKYKNILFLNTKIRRKLQEPT